MSIADHFEHAPDARFIRTVDRGAASRQFRMSLVLIVVIAVAAMALGLLVRFDTPSAEGNSATATIPTPAYVGKL